MYITFLHNLAGDNALLSFAKSIDRLVKILESESDYANYWFDENKMIINPDKF